MKITVVGMGYVGLANAVLLAQHHEVTALEIVQEKVDMLNQGRSPLADDYIEDYLANKDLNFKATSDPVEAYTGQPDYIVVAAPTDYDDIENHFDTSILESVLVQAFENAPGSPIVIKSTVPVGYTKKAKEKFQTEDLIFSPEFLREGKALYDNLYPSRIIMGEQSERAQIFADLLVEGALKEDIPVLLMDSTEAEAIKLFSNTYLALRVSYFNELDTYAEVKGLNSKQIIDGVGLDPRIGNYYNNPSFGYGGYCLPKDTKQLAANYKDVPNNLIRAIVKSNATRKNFIAQQVLKEHPERVGIYRLTMKTDSDNFRQAAIFDVMKELRGEGIDVIVYEPVVKEETYNKYRIVNDLDQFKAESDIILANRMEDNLKDVVDKLYTRDIYKEN